MCTEMVSKLIVSILVMKSAQLFPGGKMLHIDTASVEAVAEKIEELVRDRDFLGWSKQKSAASIIVKLVEKASNEAKKKEPLYEASVLLHQLYPGDRQRQEMVVREALTVLRGRRDRQGVATIAESIGLQSQVAFQSSHRSDVVRRNAVQRADVPSPFLEPQRSHK